MSLSVQPTARVCGQFSLPGDKSISHRAAMLASLAHGDSRIEGYLTAEDCLSTLECLRHLGIAIARDCTTVTVSGRGLGGYDSPRDALSVGNSGTTLRLMMGLLAAQPFETTLDGDESIRKRPMDRVATPLSMMGAEVHGRTDRCLAPVTIRGGRLRPIRYEMPVASAQVKSAILLAGLHVDGETTVVEPAASRDHTERMLKYLGVEVVQDGNEISVRGPARLQARTLRVPGDVSSAAFFAVAAAMRPGSEVVVRDVLLNPSRAAYLDVLKTMGASITVENVHEECGEPVGNVIVRGGRLRGVTIEGATIPRVIDELPILAVAASTAKGQTVIRDAKELRVKESDRVQAMTTELNRLGARIQEAEDGMLIEGVATLRGGICESYGDHRVAMSLAIAGLSATDMVEIRNPECIATSFPEFSALLRAISTS